VKYVVSIQEGWGVHLVGPFETAAQASAFVATWKLKHDPYNSCVVRVICLTDPEKVR
jgi:hypothetical protein